MWIDISNNIAFNSPNIQKSQKTAHKKAAAADRRDSTVKQNYEGLLQHAVHAYHTAASSLQKAHPAIDIQALDTPENARSAARNILKSGI